MVVLGMDEVGRGSWAGPVVVGAVVLGEQIAGLADSKLLARRARTQLAEIIRARASGWSMGEASAAEVDGLGLTMALRLAYQRALSRIDASYGGIIIDGSYNFLPGNETAETMIKADQTVPAVSAASIIAKVYRDELMAKYALEFPGYGFERHAGYGTAAHLAALRAHGPCLLHRRSFAPVRQLEKV